MVARLTPSVQAYSFRDLIRPLLVRGYQTLQANSVLQSDLSLAHAPFAIALAARELGVRLRPGLQNGETLDALSQVWNAPNKVPQVVC